jgi:hypothetical protein
MEGNQSIFKCRPDSKALLTLADVLVGVLVAVIGLIGPSGVA